MIFFRQCLTFAVFMAGTLAEEQDFPDAANGLLANSRCNKGFFLLHDECFKAILSEPLSWEDARKSCQSSGSDLASPKFICSLQEIIKNLYGREVFWVGATDQEEEGDWRWVSGEKVDPDNWMPKQPNNCCGGEDCAVLGTPWSAPLNDNNCRYRRPYVCQMGALPSYYEVIAV